MFAYIGHIDDLLPHIEQNQQIRVKVEPNGMTVACYMLQDEDTFSGPAYKYERECRGITFAVDGKIASRTLHKFFNVGEREETQPQNIQWSKVRRIMDKRDGSMITPVLVNGEVVCKTKKTFTSAEAQAATAFLHADPIRAQWCAALLQNGMTPTFEWTSPRFPIVLKYEKDELTLLHIRQNSTGEYLAEHQMKFLMPMNYPDLFPIVENIMDQFYGDGLPQRLVSWDKLRKAAEEREGIEGWIIQFENGDMVKLKTKWYCDLHHSVTFTRWRDIARVVIADQSDDLKGAFALTGRSIEPILTVERAVKARLQELEAALEAEVAIAKASCPTAKDAALKYKEHPFFGQLMRRYRDQSVNWLEYYERNELDATWSLEVVGVNE